LFDHDFRPGATDDRLDRIGIQYIRQGRLYTLFHQCLSLFWGTRQGNYSMSLGKQFRCQRTPDRSRSSRNEYLHDLSLSNSSGAARSSLRRSALAAYWQTPVSFSISGTSSR
jgi:hypothetical protein